MSGSIVIVVSVRDIKANAFSGLGCVPTLPVAIRAFAEGINGADPMHSKHPSDFELYEMGVYDTESGQIVGSTPKLVVTGLSVLERAEDARQLQLVK